MGLKGPGGPQARWKRKNIAANGDLTWLATAAHQVFRVLADANLLTTQSGMEKQHRPRPLVLATLLSTRAFDTDPTSHVYFE